MKLKGNLEKSRVVLKGDVKNDDLVARGE